MLRRREDTSASFDIVAHEYQPGAEVMLVRGTFLALLTSSFLGGCQGCKKAAPTCSVPVSSFRGGLNGYCAQLGPQSYRLHFDDGAGTRLLSLTWPDDLSLINPPSVPSVDCAQLCEAGMMVVADATCLDFDDRCLVD